MHDSDSGISPVFSELESKISKGTGIGISEFGSGIRIGIKDCKAEQIPVGIKGLGLESESE